MRLLLACIGSSSFLFLFAWAIANAFALSILLVLFFLSFVFFEAMAFERDKTNQRKDKTCQVRAKLSLSSKSSRQRLAYFTLPLLSRNSNRRSLFFLQLTFPRPSRSTFFNVRYFLADLNTFDNYLPFSFSFMFKGSSRRRLPIYIFFLVGAVARDSNTAHLCSLVLFNAGQFMACSLEALLLVKLSFQKFWCLSGCRV